MTHADRVREICKDWYAPDMESMVQQLSSYITEECNKARIDELNNLPRQRVSNQDLIDERIKELKNE